MRCRRRTSSIAVLLSMCLVARLQLQAPGLGEQLIIAAGRGNLAAVTDLLAKGADVNAENDLRGTPLSSAAEHGYVDVVKLLIERGADVDAKDMEFGRTPLTNASVQTRDPAEQAAREQIVKLLIEKGAGSEGESLRELIQRGYNDAVRAIVARGKADPAFLNQALAAAKRANATDMIELLTAAGAKDPTPRDSARSAERLQLISGLYRSQSGRELKLLSSQYEDRLLLERPGQERVALLPLDPLTLRTFDRKTIVSFPPGSLPPGEVRVRLGVWWRAGLIASALNLAIWMTAGFAWWKVIGIW